MKTQNKCIICGKTDELRFGVCFDCAEAESIIIEGLDMYGKGLGGIEEPAVSALDKLKLLIEKGWEHKDTKKIAKDSVWTGTTPTTTGGTTTTYRLDGDTK